MGAKNKQFNQTVYLDHAARAPFSKDALAEYVRVAKKIWQNPSSIYKAGIAAEQVLKESRKKISTALGAHSDEIVFTGSGSESIALAILGSVRASKITSPHIVTSAIEHPAVLEVCRSLEKEGAMVTYLLPDEDGRIIPKMVHDALTPKTVLVSVMYANNEIGTVQPITEIAKEIRHYKRHHKEAGSMYPLFHTDACQAGNYLPMKVEALGVDLLSANGIKVYGPAGVGFLYHRRRVPLESLVKGGGQEMGFRGGTEDVPTIHAFAFAFEKAVTLREKEAPRTAKLRDYFLTQLRRYIPKILIHGSMEYRLPNNINMTIPGIMSELLVVELDARGISVSFRSACKSRDNSESHVLQALRDAGSKTALSIQGEEGSARFSLGRDITKKDIDYTVKAIRDIVSVYANLDKEFRV